MSKSRLLGVVLCGGQSSRMGQDKAMLRHLNDLSFVEHAVDRLSGLCDDVCVCGGKTDAFTVLDDEIPNLGPVSGIASAISLAIARSYAACLVTPVDMPFLSVRDLQSLCQVWQSEQRLCAAVSDNDNRLQPLVAVYPVTLATAINGLLMSRDRSLVRWMQTQQPVTVSIASKSCRNINTPDDFANEYS